MSAKVLARQQARENNFNYIDGVTINPWDNSNPNGIIQFKKTSPFLSDATQWDVGILRAVFPVGAGNIPLGICPMATGATVNTTPFVVSITRNGATTNTTVTWSPEFTSEPVPTNTASQDLSSRYYWYTSVASLLSRINTALTTCASGAGSTNAPLITFDPASSMFTLYFPTSDYGSAITNAFASSLGWNDALAQLFPNFACLRSGGLVIPRVPSGAGSVTIGGVSYIPLLQESPNITAWDCLASLQMTTDLGIFPNDIIVNTTNVVTNQNNQQSLMTDIVVDSGYGTLSGGSRSGVVQFVPTSQIRWINMRSDQFSSFNIYLNWTTKGGQVYQLVLPRGSQASIKLLFKHKSVGGIDIY